jgi:L-ascorbate metabolism protein UlaG (beta-lactamase superfamily)
MKITYFGHSAFQIETAGAKILVDPFITGNEHAKGVVEPGDLEADAIILSHAHFDHVGDAASIAKRTGALVVAQFEIVMYLSKNEGVENIQPLNPGGSKLFDWGRVTSLRADHSSSFEDGTYGGVASGFVLESGEKTLYYTGDTAYFSEMERYGQDFDIDVCLLPIGDVLTMGAKDSVRAAEVLGAKQYVPLHYGTFPFMTDTPADWEPLMQEAGLTAATLEPGGTLSV